MGGDFMYFGELVWDTGSGEVVEGVQEGVQQEGRKRRRRRRRVEVRVLGVWGYL